MSQESRQPTEGVKGLGHPGSGGPRLANRSQSPSLRQAESRKQPEKHSPLHTTTPPPKPAMNTAHLYSCPLWPGDVLQRRRAVTRSRMDCTSQIQALYIASHPPPPPRLDTTVCPSTLIGGAASSAHCNAISSQSEHWD